MNREKDMVERYLQAVRFWLPKAQREDIAAELSEDLYARIEEQAMTLGRNLNEDEVVALLRQSGVPVLVAGRYRPQQTLIGPVLFPIYLFVLKIVGLCYLLPWVFLFFFSLIPALRSAHAWGGAAAFGNAVTSAFVSFGVVTLVFAAIERLQVRIPALRNSLQLDALSNENKRGHSATTWDPRKLPPLRDPRRIPRSSSIAEIIANLVFAVWWVSGVWAHTIFVASGFRIVLTGHWSVFYWGFLVLALLNVAGAVFNLLRPYWTTERAFLRLALDAAGSALFCWLIKARTLLEISAPSLSSARAAEVVHAINGAVAQAFPFVVSACIVVLALSDIGRLVRIRSGKPGGFAPIGFRPSV